MDGKVEEGGKEVMADDLMMMLRLNQRKKDILRRIYISCNTYGDGEDTLDGQTDGRMIPVEVLDYLRTQLSCRLLLTTFSFFFFLLKCMVHSIHWADTLYLENFLHSQPAASSGKMAERIIQLGFCVCVYNLVCPGV